MSTTEDQTDLKAGHPPAVKVGGMRITQHKTHTNDKPVANEPKKETDENDEAEEPQPPTPTVRQQLVISGAPARGDDDFPPASIKAFHEKPAPTMEYRPNNAKTNVIQQPRK